MTKNPRGTARASALHKVLAAALGADAQGLGKYESSVMKSFLMSNDAPTSASSPLPSSLPADGSALLSGRCVCMCVCWEHTKQDVVANGHHLKDTCRYTHTHTHIHTHIHTHSLEHTEQDVLAKEQRYQILKSQYEMDFM